MTKYRILTNGVHFKVQEKGPWTLWLFWTTSEDGEWAIFQTLSGAEDWMARRLAEEAYRKRRWYPA